MASYSSSNTEPERWAKIVTGVDSGRHPEIMINEEGTLVAVSMPSAKGARIQSFLADVFKDGDNEWFSAVGDSVEASKGKAADYGQPESSKKKKVSLTQQRANRRQEKKDKGQVMQRAEETRDSYSPAEWARIMGEASTERPQGVYIEGKKLVATDHTTLDASRKLELFIAHALRHDTTGRGEVVVRGDPSRRS
ncbi:hypothetical protein HO173_011265 [Letharia columbiana]|uniref:Uncharacterized protein n=1 Tax=Letharia columbiana TaxID=112416 RepID=A0A8H6FJK5_9LECA|nr:uncharacterized protein HO173_011265 [Letharia columbiana]KAF6229749.1 hypothetical protein HO173_011265 [Letharia columbiana]